MVHYVPVTVVGPHTEDWVMQQGKANFTRMNRFTPDAVDLFFQGACPPFAYYTLLFYVIDPAPGEEKEIR